MDPKLYASWFFGLLQLLEQKKTKISIIEKVSRQKKR